MQDARSLWPDNIAVPAVRTPVAILREQAALLGPVTKNIVEADVWTQASDDGKRIVHTFVLVAPALDNYAYPLFVASHDPVRVYPVELVPGAGGGPYVAGDEEDLTIGLRGILQSTPTREVVEALLAQSQAVTV
ncbi:MAG: hypothetical protein FJX75_22610 [Armatimonadetes bacterium]|nr:hypothetical protein [Armatimonadota bacterium]